MAENWLADYPVLLVDDERANLVVLRAELAPSFTVLTAQSGDEALDLLRHNRVAVVVSDQRMPGMTGTELCEHIHTDYPHIYRMIVTAYGDFRSAVDAINRAHVHAYLVKPWNAREVQQRLRDAIAAQRVDQLNRELMSALNSRARLLTRTHAGRKLNHDMKSVINAGHLATEFLARTVADHREALPADAAIDVDELVGSIRSSLVYLESLRKRAEKWGLQRREPKPVRVLHLLEAMRPMLPVAPAVTLRVVADPAATVMVDRVSMTRIFVNLVENACRVMDGRGMIAVVVQSDGEQVLIDVRDGGPGVPVALRDRIFELRFSTRNTDSVSGYGLSLSRELARAEGGELELLDTEPPGATFRLRLPAVSDEQDYLHRRSA